MKTTTRKSSERHSIAQLLRRVLAENAEMRLEMRRLLGLAEKISSEQDSNFRECRGVTEELMRRERERA